MAVPPPPSPLVTNRSANVINDAINPGAVVPPSLADPVALFSRDCDACNGIVSQMTPTIAAKDSSNKRKAATVSRVTQSPRRKRPASTSARASPLRTLATVAVNRIVASVNNITTTSPPNIIHRRRLPTPAVDDIFAPPIAQKKKGSSTVMLGLIPKSEFLKWPRTNHH